MASDPLHHLDRETIIAGLKRLNDHLADKGVIGEICIYGGGCMCLAFNARASTKDIDAIFVPAGVVRESAKVIGEELGLSADWLNDGVKGFVSARDRDEIEDLQGVQYSNLHVLVPTARYLLAMKCMAARTGITETDKGDILFLAADLGLSTPEQVMEIVEEFYPTGQIQPKTVFFLEELRNELATNTQNRGRGI